MPGALQNQKMTAQKANRWLVTGLGRFLSACDRVDATGVEHGVGKRTGGVLDGSGQF